MKTQRLNGGGRHSVYGIVRGDRKIIGTMGIQLLLRTCYVGALGMLSCALALCPHRAVADSIMIRSLGGDVGGSAMFIGHEDTNNQSWIFFIQDYEGPPGPPGSEPDSDDWLRPYTEVVNMFGQVYEARKDYRYPDAPNEVFIVYLDTQYKDTLSYGDPITSQNNKIQFVLESPVSEGREFYQWSMTLDPSAGASWADGLPGNTRSGIWDLAVTGGQGGTYDLPFYNLTNAQGQYGILDVVPLSAVTTLGTPISWYIDRRIITNDYELIDTTDFNDDGYTGRQKFLMNVDDLFDDSDYFKTIGLSLTNGTPAIVIPHSKTDRRYRLHATPSLSPPDWTSPTNALGTGGSLTLEAPDDESPARFFKATVELP